MPLGVWPQCDPPQARNLSKASSFSFCSHQRQVRVHTHLTLMENLPRDSWSGLSEQACDSEGGQAKLPLHREEAHSGATTPTRLASGHQGQHPRLSSSQENVEACGRQPPTPTGWPA